MSTSPEVQRAEALINAGKQAEAVPILMSVVKADRDNEYAWTLLAQAVDKPEHKARVQAEIERIQRSREAAFSLDEYDLPEPELPEKPKRQPVTPTSSTTPDVGQLLGSARDAIQTKDYTRAHRILQDVLRLEPGNTTAQRWMERLDDEATFGPQNSAPAPSHSPVLIQQRGPGCLIQFLWFVFIGWWLGLGLIWLGYFLMMTIILLPIGLWVLNNISQAMTLRKRPTNLLIGGDGTVTNLNQQIPQRGFALRAIWFVLVGWWLTGFWLHISYALSVFIFTMPLGFWMFDQVPTILTLRRLPPRRVQLAA